MSDSEELVFRGIDATECEGFIRSIRRVALSKERQHDNAWIALYAGSCFAGGALRWYEKLDDDVQEDWKRLRVAMLEKWPEDGQEDEVTVEIVPPSYFPTPAAAAPPPSLPPLSPPPLPQRPPVSGDSTGGLSNAFGGLLVNRRYGVLAVETPQSKLYLYHKRNSSGCFPSSKSAESALRVEFDVGAPPHRIRVRNVQGCSWLAIKWNSTVGLAPGSTKPIGIVGVNEADSFTSSDPNRRKWRGPHRASVWSVASDGSVQAFWEEKVTCLLTCLWRQSDNLVMFVSDPGSYTAKYPAWTPAKLVFEASLG